MTEGLGYTHIRQMLPKANFSSQNPYWQRVLIPSVYPEYQPQKSARDFLYATTWELWREDVVGACFVRLASIATVRWNWLFSFKQQIQDLLRRKKP